MNNTKYELGGSREVGDAVFNEIQYPTAHRFLTKCDAILRIEGASKGADLDVKKLGLSVYYKLNDIPNAEQ